MLDHLSGVLHHLKDGGDENLKEQLRRSLHRLRTAALRGGAAGLTLRGGLNVFGFLLRVAKRWVAERRDCNLQCR